MARKPKNSPSFFKFFNEETCAERMAIPKRYILHMLDTLNALHRVHLRDQYGNHWPVKMANIGNQWYFEEGWPKFVKDNSIENEDLLFFQYDGNKVFHVKLSGKDGCDKKGVGAFMSKEGGEEHMEVKTIDDEETEEEKVDEEIEEEEDQSHAEQVEEEMVEEENQSHEEEKEEVGRKRSGGKRGRAKAPDYYGKDIFKAGILPLPENPYFVTKIRVNRREELYIPMEVLKDCSIEKLPNEATLRDSRGRTWTSKLKTWADGRKFYIGGWASFCRVNFVGDNDLCICEFVKNNKKNLTIQLQVVPARD